MSVCAGVGVSSPGEEKVTLHGLRLQVAQGELLGICGEVSVVHFLCSKVHHPCATPPRLLFGAAHSILKILFCLFTFGSTPRLPKAPLCGHSHSFLGSSLVPELPLASLAIRV